MTFQELQDKIGTQNEADWHQHSNGGGWVHKSAIVKASARIEEMAIVFSGKVFGDAWVSGNARVSGNAQVSGNARVSGDAWEKSPLYIVGTKHTLTNAKKGHIQIGCHLKPIQWWAENYKDVGKMEGYTEAEIEEYGAYIDLFKRLGK